MQENKKPLKLAIFSPNKSAVSETFIRAHLDGLPFTVIARYGSEWAIEDEKGKKIWPSGPWIGSFLRSRAPTLYQGSRNLLLAHHLKAIRADAVLAEYGVTGSWLAPACERAQVPLFVHFHGYDASVEELLQEYGEGYQRIFKTAAGIVAVSKAMYGRLLSMGAPKERLYLNPCGADPDRFCGGAPQYKPPAFFGAGRFVEKKAPHLTILAFSRVLGEIPEATLTLVGQGPLFGPCKRLVQALGIERSVRLLGEQTHEVVRSEMLQARAFVQHSLVAENGDSEGTPVGVVEAQMAGIPVVATRHAGIPDVVVDDVTGYLVEEADVDGMARAMIKLALNKDLAGRMGLAARARAIDHFSLERHLRYLAEMIEGAVSKRSLAYASA